MAAESIYILCALTSVLAAGLLLRTWRRNRVRLIFWVALCFVFLAANNIVLYIDLIVFPTQIDLSLLRSTTALVAFVPLLYGLIWDSN